MRKMLTILAEIAAIIAALIAVVTYLGITPSPFVSGSPSTTVPVLAANATLTTVSSATPTTKPNPTATTIAIPGNTLTTVPTATPTARPTPIAITFEVFAKLSWQNTGVQTKAGDKLEIIYLQGQWRGIDRGDYSAPFGSYIPPPSENRDCMPMPQTESGWNALISKIGENGKPSNPFKKTPSGESFLFVELNDCDEYRDDNSGSVVIRIELSRKP